MDANSDEPWSDLIVSQPSYSGAHHHSRYQNQVALSEPQGRWQLRDGTGSVREASAIPNPMAQGHSCDSRGRAKTAGSSC